MKGLETDNRAATRATEGFLTFLLLCGAALLIVAVTAVFCAIALSLLHDQAVGFQDFLPTSPSETYKTAISLFAILIPSVIAALGVLLGVVTYKLSTRNAALERKKQHTITILFETRLSEQFQNANKLRQKVFPKYTDISFDDWNTARLTPVPTTGSPEQIAAAQLKIDGAEALTMLLNYYEFLAVGVSVGDLDEELLRKTIRGIMCNLVDDARDLIAEFRRKNPKTYANLIELYENWREKDAKDVNGHPTERPIPRK